MNPLNSLPQQPDPAPSPIAPTAPALPPARGGRDEKIFFAIVGAGILFIAAITVLTLMRASSSVTAPTEVPLRQLVDFTLTDRTGQKVQRADLNGRILIVNFVFTSCSIDCLQVNYRMTELQKLTADRPDVRLVSISVDPKSDTPAMLARFANRFEAQTNRWLFLTGEHRVVYSLIEDSLLGPSDGNIPGVIPGVFVHSDQIALVDATGRLRALFNGLKRDVAQDVMTTLAQLEPGSMSSTAPGGPGGPTGPAAGPL